VSIYVSDNCSTDDTKAVVAKRAEDYPLVCYSCNRDNLGPDKNFEIALCMPSTDYVWLLGDTYQIEPNCLEFLLSLLSENGEHFDAVVVNANHRVQDIASKDFVDRNELLGNLGWHMTCMSSLIYNRRLLRQANFNRYRDTDFIQVGIIFEYIEDREFLIKWVGDQSVLTFALDGVPKISWQDRIFEVWVEKWSNFVFSLPPAYDIGTKLRCIKAHGSKSGVFSLKSLSSARALGHLNLNVLRRYKHLLYWTIPLPRAILLLIAVAPMSIFRITRFIYHKLPG
jgi:abequosyltransferase